MNGNGWEKVVFAADLELCSCGEPFCTKHEMHYADCPCIGPTEDGVEYEEDGNGVLWGRRIEMLTGDKP